MERSLKLVLLHPFYSPIVSANGLTEIPKRIASTVPRKKFQSYW